MSHPIALSERMAGTTRLKLATSAVTVPKAMLEATARSELKWYSR